MKNRFFIILLITVAMFLFTCGDSGSGDDDDDDDLNVTGSFVGHFYETIASSPGTTPADASGTLTQNGTSCTGVISVNPPPEDFDCTGTLTGNTFIFSAVSQTTSRSITGSGTFDGTVISGTWEDNGSPPYGGTFDLEKQ
jgi:hypothetical protein